MLKKQQEDRLVWLDIVRGVSIIWIFLVHFIERFMKGSYFGNPSGDWPSLADRFSQLIPLRDTGFLVNALRYVGWLGDQGVQVFIIASGFGLTYSIIKNQNKMHISFFYKNRLLRIFPQWWVLHILLMGTAIFIGFGLKLNDWRTYASFIGIQFLPQTLGYYAAAWWFIGLLIQLYIIFPFIYKILVGTNGLRNILIIAAGSIVIRTVGLYLFSDLLGWWSRGGVFITRLPEFIFGMIIAVTIKKKLYLLKRLSENILSSFFWIGIWLAGTLLSFTLIGMSVAYLLSGAGIFMFIYTVFRKRTRPLLGIITWVGFYSLGIFLVHHPILNVLVQSSLSPSSTNKIIVLLFITLTLSILFGFALTKLTDSIVKFSKSLNEKLGILKTILRLGIYIGVVVFFLFTIEFTIQSTAPQEVLGWGEKRSLTRDQAFGYKLKPSSVTRLRWLSYDYVVSANSLGFPGPLYPQERQGETLRLMVVGDAFTSAEGVNTEKSWPRILEKRLNKSGIKTEVLNFSITGWGPNQYEEAVRRFAPQYAPDMIVIGFFVNEFFDIRIKNSECVDTIGFNKPAQNSIYSLIRLTHLKTLLKDVVKARLSEMIGNGVYWRGYFLGNFNVLDRKNLGFMKDSSELIYEKFQSMLEIAAENNSSIKVLLIPAPVQVAGPDKLKYYPRNINISNKEKWDINQPQKLAENIFKKLSIDYIDLRSTLIESTENVYQSKNMHWTEAGHEVVAEKVFHELVSQ